jgi:hypothetical protein
LLTGPAVRAHGLTAPGFDGVAYDPKTGVAYNPKTKEMIIYDNQAYKRAGNASKVTAIDPQINLRKNLDDLIQHIETHPNLKDLPHRNLILHRLTRTR